LKKKFDVIVVGAGTAGCLIAKIVADEGFDVCLIDQKKKENIGEKVCGNAVGKHHFDNRGLDYPTGKEHKRKIVGGKLYSPDTETVLYIEGAGLPGFMIDRRLLGQRLLRNAVDSGSTVFDSTRALDVTYKKGFVTGVLTKNLKERKDQRFDGKVVVDASGVSAVLRTKLPPEFKIETNIENEDVAICYREIRELKNQIEEPEFIQMYFNQKISPGGYYWIFSEEGKIVNVGLGVSMHSGFPNPKKQLYDFVLSKPQFEGSTVLKRGGGKIPTRSPLSSMVGNGVLIVGDAACQVNPITGGGIGTSMLGGTLAGETINEALQKEDVSIEGLWPYNVKYVQSYGIKQAGLDVFRLILQTLSNEDLNFGMKYRLITEEDVLRAAMEGKAHLNITEKTRRLFRGIRKLGLLKKLQDAVNVMEEVKDWHRKYPLLPQEIDEWKRETLSLMQKVKQLKTSTEN
jgi:geranylgeranyl reductase family protein